MNIQDDLGAMRQRLKELADVINAFKSEAVQLKVLDLLTAGAVPDTSVSARKTDMTARKRRRPKAAKDKPTPSRPPGQAAARGGAGRGAFAIVSALITEGFFKTPRTIGDLIEHSGTQKGRHFKANEVSPALLRLLRNGTLNRKKNKDNQYEYVQK